MIRNGFESRVKVQEVVENQLPSFLLDESPNASKFLEQYYISQEYQGGPIDIVENLDQYLKPDNLIPEITTGSNILVENIGTNDTTIIVSPNTKGFPNKYGLLKIDNEIITYTEKTENSFLGCIRGFSGIERYKQDLNREELVFNTTSASTHSANAFVENLSSLFLKEFFAKIKKTFLPGFEELSFANNVNIGNFIKQARGFYESKGTNESFRILFNVLYGVTPKVINLENYLLKPSSANYIRREIVLADIITSSSNPLNLEGQNIYRSLDSSVSASVSEIEPFNRNGVEYFKISLFIGYTDSPNIQGEFSITPKTKVLEYVDISDTVITVDSTIGFPESGTIFSGSNKITYSSKSINQFFGCSNITTPIQIKSDIISNDTYYGYENGDITKKVEFSISGSLSDFIQTSDIFKVDEQDEIFVDSLGELIRNPRSNPTKKEIFANSWIYNTSSTYNVETFTGSQFKLTSPVDKSNLKKGDPLEIVDKVKNIVIATGYVENEISYGAYTVDIGGFNPSIQYDSNINYGLRRKIRNPIISGVQYQSKAVSDIQNVYSDGNEYMYVASNSLPSGTVGDGIYSYEYQPSISVKSINNLSLIDELENEYYASLSNENNIPFLSGDQITYQPSGNPIIGLSTGNYFVEVLKDSNKMRLYTSNSLIGTNNYVKMRKSSGQQPNSEDVFTLTKQKDNYISPQKLLKKFILNPNIKNSSNQETEIGSIGMLINGVEITNYKSNDKVYYGPLESVKVLNSGTNYDVINLPKISILGGVGNTALVQPVISGSVKEVFVDSQDFEIDKVISVSLKGGNGSGAVLEAVVSKRNRSVFFDARTVENGGGINTVGNTLTFIDNHNFSSGEEIIYNNSGNTSLGIGTLESSTLTLSNNSKYFAHILNNKAIQLFETKSDYISGINTVGFITANTSGIHKFTTSSIKNTVSEIKVIKNGSGYTNRKLIVKPSGISTSYDTVYFKNHNFNNGDLIEYDYETSPISGLTTTNQYFILKQDHNTFRLCDAGIGGTITSNFKRKEYIKLESTGTGYQYFKYPNITASLVYTNVGLGTTTQERIINLTPSISGSIIDAYLYEEGTGYGSSIINLEKTPTITIKTGIDAKLVPNIINGQINSVSIEYGGREFYSVPTLDVIDSSGTGSGAKLRAIIDNGKISDVKIISAGIGYSSTSTSIKVISSGSNAIIDSNVRSLTINNRMRFGQNDIVMATDNNLQYSIVGYSLDYLNIDNSSKHSPIIGWAYDGNPIYGPYGYNNPGIRSDVTRLKTGYTLDITNIIDRPSINDFGSGMFVEDYVFTNPSDCHLDEYNGRFAKTDEFPDGIYAYYATIDEYLNPIFPYFIGNKYRSDYISENSTINQSFDFRASNLIRNTFPYNMSDRTSDYDFVEDSVELSNQKSIIESVSEGSVNKINIVYSGTDYKVNDTLEIDNIGTSGSGLSAKISSIKGKDIVSVETTTQNESGVFVWNNLNEVQVNVFPYHNFVDGDSVTISGFSTDSSLNGSFNIGVSSYTSSLTFNIPSVSSIGSTEIYVSEIPPISIGSSAIIGSETLKILNIFKKEKILTVKRGDINVGHSTGALINFIPDSFTIPVESNYFNSYPNNKEYFNPTKSIGFGTEVGVSTSVTFSFGISSLTREIPSQSIYIKNHSFANNELITLTVPSGGAISISTSSDGPTFNLPQSGLTTNVYVSNIGKDLIGIKTTIDSNKIFFRGGGLDSDEYLLESNVIQVIGNIKKVNTKVSVSTSHYLSNGDTINLSLQSNLNSGIGNSTSIRLIRDTNTEKLLINNLGFNSTGINTSNSTIVINSHNFKTGDKIKYSSNVLPLGLNNSDYYVYKVDDDTFQLSKTYYDTQLNPPSIIAIGSTGGENQNISLINSQITIVKGNNLVFDLSDSSLLGYNLKIYTDNEFKNEFVSTGSSNNFNVIGLGTPGNSGATLTTLYNAKLPTKLYYNLEKSGYISTSDNTVINYNEIIYIDSVYTGTYKISGVGNTYFNIVLNKNPERSSYTNNECSILEYSTNSLNSKGGIDNIKIISTGSGYKKLPKVLKFKTSEGKNANISLESSTIGNSKEVRVVNNIFQYPSDPTLNPSAFVAPIITTKNSNTIGFVSVTDGGIGYSIPPSIVITDSQTNQVIDTGLLKATLVGSSISKIDIDLYPKGLPDNGVNLFATNNTNGISITKVESDSTGIFTCHITTPILGFTESPFVQGQKVFIEGIIKNGSDGTGFNSEDYGYKFFEVSNYVGTPGTSDNPSKVTLNISGLTTNTGIAKTIQDSFATIIPQSDYPIFDVKIALSNFMDGEQLLVNGLEKDLFIISGYDNFVKLSGSYRHDLKISDLLLGKQSKNSAVIDKIHINKGRFYVNYSNKKNLGWFDSVGLLNDNQQRTSNNDYYQTLSYSIKSPITWDNQKTPINDLLHTSGMKNFADTEIISSKSIGIGSDDGTTTIIDLISDNRVDTVYEFDFAKDLEILSNRSKFIKFKNITLSSYTQIQDNLVYSIDDINNEFSNLKDLDNPDLYAKIYQITENDRYKNLLVRVTDNNNTQIQLSDLVILNNGDDISLLNKGELSNIDEDSIHTSENNYGQFSVITDDFGRNFLIFEPVDPYTRDYNIKVIEKENIDSIVGVATTTFGFVNLTNSTHLVSSGITTTIIGFTTTTTGSIAFSAEVRDTVTKDLNFVDIKLTHDGSMPYMLESYYDSTGKIFSGNNIGSFGSDIDTNTGVISLNFTNDSSSNDILINSRIIGIGTTSLGNGTHRFRTTGQSDDDNSVESVKYFTNWVSNKLDDPPAGYTAEPIVYSLDSSKFNTVKSLVQVSVGNTVALYQVLVIHDSTNTYMQTNEFLFTDAEDYVYAGIGTFTTEFSGSNFELKFAAYNDYDDTLQPPQNLYIQSYNEAFFTNIDNVNIPNDLVYGNMKESTYVSTYAGINGDIGNKKQFTLKTDGTPIFAKTFNPSDSTTVNLSTGVFSIDNHFFRNNEELIYTPKSTFVGVGSTPMQYENSSAGIVDTLPSNVFAIVVNENSFKISTTRSGTAVTFTGVGEGNAHQFEMAKRNEKAVITLDNIVQYPLIFTPINQPLDGNGGSISTTATTFSLSGISSISANSIIRIDDEYMKVVNVGFGTTSVGPITGIGTTALVEVERGILGSISTSHNDTTGIATVYKGSYNIVGSDIFFTDAPRGNANEDKNIMNLDTPTSEFTGRVYFRSDYSSNQIYDDISDQFTGIGRTFTLTVGGANTAVGLGTEDGQNQNGLLFLNGLFQTPETDNNPSNNFIITSDSTAGISTVVFSGITVPNTTSIFSSEVDVNRNEVPRGGLVVSLGSTGGLGYAPLVGASVTAVVSGGVIQNSIGIGSTDIVGSGYNGIVPIGVSVFEEGHTGDTAEITATVGVGGTLTFNVTDGGSGYTNPQIFVDSPSYGNLNPIGISRLGVGSTTDTGRGLQVSVEVGAASTTVGIGSTHFEVKSFNISRQGYEFKRGDKFTLVGLVTDARLSEPLEPFTLEVLDVYSDDFALWQLGDFDYIDSIKDYQDGTRTNFPLYYNQQIRSFESKDGKEIDFSNHLLIIINGIIQKPGQSYVFDGGTSFDFLEAPSSEDNIDIFFYKGVEGSDTINKDDIKEFIHVGDSLQLTGFNKILEQDKRIVYDLRYSDKVETNTYYNQGISTSYRPINLIKQKRDQKINGVFESKIRESIQSQIYPSARIIKDLNTSSTDIFLDNAEFFKEDTDGNLFDLLIVSQGSSDPVSAAITATVGVGGTILVDIIDGGSGYTSTPTISISAPPIIGIGIGTTATATASINGLGSVNSVSIVNPGFGYTNSIVPKVLVSSPNVNYEMITGINTANITGFSGIITGIGTTSNGSNLGIEFSIYSDNDDIIDNTGKSIITGTPIYIFDTRVGNVVTSMDVTGINTVGIGTSFIDNVYYSIGNWQPITGNLGIVTCYIHPDTSVVGITSTGSIENPVGRFSWGRMSNVTISQISIGVTGLTIDAGLSSFPSVQRRGSFGVRYTGALGK